MGNNALIIAGYIVFTLYTCGIMAAGVLLERKTKIDPEICRKITHIISAFVWVICYCFFGCSLHWVILNGIGTVALGLVTFGAKPKAFARSDAGASLGLFYFGLSTFVVAVICYCVGKELYLYTGIAYYCLALGDGFAPITAKLFGKRNVTLLPHKTLVGTLTVYLVAFLATVIFNAVFQMGLSPVFMLSVAALTCMAEFYGFKGLDNLFIEFSVFGYLLLYHYGLAGLPLQTVLIACPLLACGAMASKTMTMGAGVCAFLLFALVGFFSRDFTALIFMALLFGISTVVSVATRKRGQAHGPRGWHQITAVGLFALIALGIFRFTGIRLFYGMYFLALTEQFADSMASDLGSLTDKKNVNIITFQSMEKGISGGVSALGTLCALAGSFVLMLVPLLCGGVTPVEYVMISLLAFVGTLLDSVIGALFQALYRCESCGRLVESPMHCGRQAEKIKGFSRIDNTAVNYIAGFLTCAMGSLLLLI